MASELTALLNVLRELQRIDPAFPLQYALCLTEIALDEGLSLTALAERTGISLPTVSRIVAALSSRRPRGLAYGLVTARLSPGQRRLKELHLTMRGRAVIGRVALILTNSERERLSA